LADGGSFLRLFVALEVPEPHRISVEKAIQTLRLRLPEARWTPRESWHVTFKFLGEVPEERYDDLVRVVQKVVSSRERGQSKLTELGAFPSPRRARVLWVGLDDPGGAMEAIASSLERDLGRRGFRQEARRFHPHLTLARLRVPRPVLEEVTVSGPYELDRSPFDVAELVLFRSHLSPKGATYEALERFRLGSS
jgi:2'-5' RNA ligase